MSAACGEGMVTLWTIAEAVVLLAFGAGIMALLLVIDAGLS